MIFDAQMSIHEEMNVFAKGYVLIWNRRTSKAQ